MFSSDKSYFYAVAAEVDLAHDGRKAATRLRRIFLWLGYVFICTLLAIGFGGCGQFAENQFKTKAVYDAPHVWLPHCHRRQRFDTSRRRHCDQRRLEGSGDPHLVAPPQKS
jgi:hypothetical protein